jgi:hypothetical protein
MIKRLYMVAVDDRTAPSCIHAGDRSTMQDPFIRSDQQGPPHTFNLLPSIHHLSIICFPNRLIDRSQVFFLPRQTAGRLDWTSPYAVRVVLPFISYTCVTLAGKHMAGLSYGDGDKEASISLSEHSA